MPGGSGRARRSCPMCKPNKFAGNESGKWGAGKRTNKEMARAPGNTRSERSRLAQEEDQ